MRVLESDRAGRPGRARPASGIPKCTASRLLSALERQGLVEQDGERGRLRPGPAILRVAERSLLERNVVELAAASLDALGEASGETINLAVPARSGVEHLAQVESRHFLGAGQWLGRSVDYHCTAVGKVFMAFGRATIAAAPLAQLTPQTVTSPARLREPSSRRCAPSRSRPPSTSSRPGSRRSPRRCTAPAVKSSPRSPSPGPTTAHDRPSGSPSSSRS